MSPKFNPPNLLVGQPRHQPTMSRDELRAAIKRLREIDALHPEPTPDTEERPAPAVKRLREAISGERRDWHVVEVRPDDVAALLADYGWAAAHVQGCAALVPASEGEPTDA